MWNMLKQQNRLRNTRRIREVRRSGSSESNRWLVVSSLPGEETESRFAFSVSRRIGNAVTRNRIKRLMREAVRRNLPHMSDPCDVILIARTAARSASYAEIERAVTDLLHRARICTGSNQAAAVTATGAVCE